MNSKNIIIKRIKRYFNNREDIAFAFLFGSQANEHSTSLSDIDIAVYFYPKNRVPIEFEKPIYYEKENEIWADLERMLKKEVDLLILNRSPATISDSAIRGIPIIIKNWVLYLDFMEVVTSEGIDFREMIIKDFMEKL